MAEPSQLSHSSVPVPDPTALTDKAIERATGIFDGKLHALREYMTEKVESSFEIVKTRLNGMDKAIELFQGIQDRIPSIMDEKINRLRALHQEKFDSIGVQFAERDTRTEQTAAGVKIAVDAALQAAKEAVAEQNRSFALATGKSETATMKQIDALGLAIQTANKGLDDKIADMKDRLTRIEGMDLGSNRQRDQRMEERAVSHSGNQNTIAIIAASIAGIAAVAAIISLVVLLTRPTYSPSMLDHRPASLWEKAIYGWLPGTPDPIRPGK